MKGGKGLFIVVLAAICVGSFSSENELKVRIPRQRDGPRPAPPPPVEPDFSLSCTKQKERSPTIMCEADSTFSPVQCTRHKCFCVASETGLRINDETFPLEERDSIECDSAPDVCSGSSTCSKVCRGGYQLDQNKCRTCGCKAPPPSERCTTIRDLVISGTCSCQCIVDPSVTPTTAAVTDVTTAAATNVTTTLPPIPTGAIGGRGRRAVLGGGSNMCPSCDLTCSSTTSDRSCAMTNQEQCGEGTTLKSVGLHGRSKCVQDLGLRDTCVQVPELETKTSKKEGLTGATRRKRAGEVGEAPPPCGADLVCKEVKLKGYACVEEDSSAPCVVARRSTSNLRCDPEGIYRPLQCRPVNTTSGTQHRIDLKAISSTKPHLCRCVNPNNGSGITGTEKVVTNTSGIPDCSKVIDYEDCSVRGLNSRSSKKFRVSHGETYFDADNCRTCECRNGNNTALCSSSGNCTSVRERTDGSTPSNCQLSGGDVVKHNEQRAVGCETCGCRYGRLRCTKKRRSKCMSGGTTPAPEDECDRCKRVPTKQVCGPDGRNHLSRCSAIQCAGIPAVDLQDGPCQSQNACEDYPCTGENEVCINKKGTVACLGKRGCKPQQLRTCLDADGISCPVVNTTISEGSSEGQSETSVDEQDGSESTEICGTDNQTYQSICYLLQTSTNVHILHAGACNTGLCRARKVCGSDGFTYNSICELENQAAVRLDYPGECMESSTSFEDQCKKVVEDDRCMVNAENCEFLVSLENSCCPVCGGAIQVVIDVDALSDASDTNPEINTVDFFTISLLKAVELQDVASKCSVEVSLTTVGNLLIVFQAQKRRDAQFCYQATRRLENLISQTVEGLNDTTTDGVRQKRQVQSADTLPQAYTFVMAASAIEVDIQEQGTDQSNRATNGGTRVEAVSGMMTLLILVTLGLVKLFF